MSAATGPIVLFDGECNFCSGGVNFLIRHDKEGKFRFASLQSEAGKKLLADRGLQNLPLSTSVLIDGDKVFMNSDGVLETARRMGGVFALAAGLLFVPRPLRDWAYGVFARNRYKIFGRAETCMVPTPDVRRRFLDLA